ncbi:unnamed protein product, partial [Linum tenue]
SNVGWNLNELSFLSSAYSQQQSSVVIEDITSASATVTSGGKCSEEESLLGLSASLAQIVELGMEEVGSSPDLLREKTMKDVLARRKAPPLSPQERALRQLGVEGDVDSILMVGRPKRNGSVWEIPLTISLRGGAEAERVRLMHLLSSLPHSWTCAGPAHLVWPLERSSIFSASTSLMIRLKVTTPSPTSSYGFLPSLRRFAAFFG